MHDISQRMHFVIMQSVFDTEKEIHEKFDLKVRTAGSAALTRQRTVTRQFLSPLPQGSLVNRFATEEEKAKEDCVLKDLDLNQRGLKIKLGPKRKMFLEQLRRDAEVCACLRQAAGGWLGAVPALPLLPMQFLASLGIMDYSLLLGVHYRSKAHVKGVRKRSVHMSEAVCCGCACATSYARSDPVTSLTREPPRSETRCVRRWRRGGGKAWAPAKSL